MQRVLTFLFTISLFSVQAQSDSALSNIFAALDSIDSKYEIQNPIWEGEHPREFVFQKAEQQIAKASELELQLEKLKAVSDASLTNQEQINKSIKVLQLNNQISTIRFKTYLIPFDSEGGFFNSPSFFLSDLPFETSEDYQSYFRWIKTYSDFISYHITLLKQGIKEEIQAPKVIVRNVIELLEPWVQEDATTNPFYAPIKNIPSKVQDKSSIEKKGKDIISKEDLSVYQELYRFIKEEYIPAAPEKVGISEIKDGRTYYEDRVRHFTTLDITPDSVYAIGLSEVARIRALMDQIIEDVSFDGSFADFLDFLRTDPRFYPKTGQELLNKAAWLSKKAEGQLPKLFSRLYELPFTVEPVPDNIAPKYTGGRYVGGSKEQGKAGIYWVNTYNLPSRTLYTLPALTLHEAVPGHHLQITLASELEDLPDFRRNYYISAFGEGWGLYSEYLGEEMGMYETPYDLFGRYTYEMWRACRLVVDVGLHYKGWTRQQAVDYMAGNTALSLHEVNTEIDRYIGWPGQAVSYKMGELTIKKLRAKATKELGNQFDIKAFHDAILKNGSVPLPILEKEIDSYISAQKGN